MNQEGHPPAGLPLLRKVIMKHDGVAVRKHDAIVNGPIGIATSRQIDSRECLGVSVP
jgi:hypothetical protein